MIINNTNIRGIWGYSDSLVFEEGDFVVKGDQIYICKASGVMGKDPASPANRDYFTEYPGNMVGSVEEYYNIINNSAASDDLYISSRVLNEILQDSYFGLGDNGVITSVIESDGTLRGQIEKLGNPEHILDELILAPDFNNGVVLVSREFKDISNLIGLIAFVPDSQDTTPTNGGSLTKSVVRVDPSNCVECGGCITVCPLGAIEISGSDEVRVCQNCGHVASPEEEALIHNGSTHYECPDCGCWYWNRKSISSYTINTSVCDLCGKCMNYCPSGAIYTTEELAIDKTISDTSTETVEGSQSFSNLISKYQVSDLNYVFVRQYSYKSGATGVLHRIQELVDPDQGLIFFRHAKQKDGNLTMDSTSWQSCLSRDAILIGRELNRIRERLDDEKAATVTSGFRYRSIDFSPKNNNSYFISNGSLPTVASGVKRVVTLVLELQGTTISSYSTSIDLSAPDNFKGNGKTYYINDNLSIVIKSSADGFDLDFGVDSNREVLTLRDVYCREAC